MRALVGGPFLLLFKLCGHPFPALLKAINPKECWGHRISRFAKISILRQWIDDTIRDGYFCSNGGEADDNYDNIHFLP